MNSLIIVISHIGLKALKLCKRRKLGFLDRTSLPVNFNSLISEHLFTKMTYVLQYHFIPPMTYESQLQKLRLHYRDYKKLPTYEEMREIFGCKSKSTAYYTINRLIRAGFLKKVKSRLVPGKHFSSLPYYKSVRAGFPSPAEEEGNDRMSLDEYLVDQPNSTFFLKVKGDSMDGAGILEGDIVIVQRTSDAYLNQTVVVSVEGQLVVKMLRKTSNQFILESANPNYPDLPLEDYVHHGMVGVVKGVVRKLSS